MQIKGETIFQHLVTEFNDFLFWSFGSVSAPSLCDVAALSCADQGLEMGGLGSRRGSQVGEKVPFESSVDVLPPKRRRKKKTATIGED